MQILTGLTLDSLSGNSLGMPRLMCLPSEAAPSLADFTVPKKKNAENFNKKLEISAPHSPILVADGTEGCYMNTRVLGQSPRHG